MSVKKIDIAFRKLVLILLILSALILINSRTAKADIAGGKWGTCTWTITNNGTLTIGAGTGANTGYKNAPWYNNRYSIKSIHTSGKVVLPQNCSYLFYGLSKVENIDMSGFDTTHVSDMSYMFSNCLSLTSLKVSMFNTKNVENMSNMFYSCSSLSSLDLSAFDTNKVGDMSYMFCYCSSLSSLNVSSFNTSNVKQMNNMFNGCMSLSSLDISGFNTSSATNLSSMFEGCSSLTKLNTSGFNTSSASDMHGMFSGCRALISLDVSNFDTNNTTDMHDMFDDCSSITQLDVSKFNTSKVTDISYMFADCSALSSIDISQFDTSNVSYINNMFRGCSSLKSIKLGQKSGLTSKKGQSSGLKDITPSAENSEVSYTGNWTKSSPYNHSNSISGKDLETKYATNSSDFGNFDKAIWVWEINGQQQTKYSYQSKDGTTNGKPNVVSLSSDIPVKEQINSFALDASNNKTGYWTKLDDKTWTYTFYVSDTGVSWKSYEDDINGYTGDYTKTSPLDIDTGTDEAIITNTSDKTAKQKYGALKITKKLDGSAATDISFSFDITLTDESGKGLSGNAIFGGTAFSNGKATVSVDAGGSIDISDIPTGYHYSIKELPAHGYIQESFTNQNGVVPEGTTEAVCTSKYIPERETDSHAGETVNLTINKVCSSNTSVFKFNISISSINAGETVDAEIKTTSSSAAQKKTYTPDKNGEINEEEEISGTGSIVLSGIPVGAKYRITEDASPYLASYNIADANNKGLINKTEDANNEINTPLSTMEEIADSGEDVKLTFTNARPKYPVLFTKRDEKDDFVEGAVLEVSDSNGTKITSWTTAAGESKELSLEPGTYTLKEASVPSGYAKAADISFTVDDAGKIFIDGAEVSDIEMIDNSTETTVSISKIDDYAFPVAGAMLSLVDNSTGKTIGTWQTDNKPRDIKLSFGKTYTLSEDSAPAGYEKAADIKIDVGADGSITIDGKKSSTATVKMVDSRKAYVLPSTGGRGNKSTSILITVLAISLCFVLLKSKNKHKNSN